MNSTWPSYRRLLKNDELGRRAREATALLADCTVCPRQCHVDRRQAGAQSYCHTGQAAIISSAFPHHGEEDCLRGWNGSGTIFFSQCNLRCVFCQNFNISWEGHGRPVPSADARHTRETYLCVLNVEGLEAAIYRYLPLEHELLLEFHTVDARQKLVESTLGQSFVGQAAVTFIWTAIPYRMEWRYGLAAHKVIALDAGHICQNLYLACEAIGAGTCAVAAYHQQLMDRFVRVNGTDEFVIYLAPVGKV